MTAGLNLRGDVWTFTHNNSPVGGAMPTGTITYRNAELRISPNKPTLALLEQGLETPRIYSGVLSPTASASTFSLTENQQIQITWPPISEHYLKFFVVIGVQPASMQDARKYWLITLRRLETANSNLNQ